MEGENPAIPGDNVGDVTSKPTIDNIKGEEPKPTDPHKKPFTFVFSRHSNVDTELQLWRAEIDHLLETNPEGKVAVVIESSNVTQNESDYIRAAIDSGKSLSQAINEGLDAGILPRNQKIPAHTNFKKFNNARDAIIEELLTEHPERLRLIHEWGSPELIAKNMSNTASYYTPDQSLDEAVAPILTKAEGLTGRDEQIAQIIKDILAEEDVIGGVALFGSVHTQISHALIRERYNIRRLFKDKKEGEPYYYGPTNTLLRNVRFYPGTKITRREVATAQTADTAIVLSGVDPSVEAHQAAFKTAHKWLIAARKPQTLAEKLNGVDYSDEYKHRKRYVEPKTLKALKDKLIKDLNGDNE